MSPVRWTGIMLFGLPVPIETYEAIELLGRVVTVNILWEQVPLRKPVLPIGVSPAKCVPMTHKSHLDVSHDYLASESDCSAPVVPGNRSMRCREVTIIQTVIREAWKQVEALPCLAMPVMPALSLSAAFHFTFTSLCVECNRTCGMVEFMRHASRKPRHPQCSSHMYAYTHRSPLLHPTTGCRLIRRFHASKIDRRRIRACHLREQNMNCRGCQEACDLPPMT